MSTLCNFDIHRHGTVILRRPIHELKNHITHFKMPSIDLLMRVVKTFARAIFRWHLCETDAVIVNTRVYFAHNLDGVMTIDLLQMFMEKHRFVIESAAIFVPKMNQFEDRINFGVLRDKQLLSLTNVMTYFRDTLNDPRFRDESILWNHDQFTRLQYIPDK